MSASLDGAIAAMRDKFVEKWISSPGVPRTAIVFVNEPQPSPWPPKDADGKLLAWVLLEIAAAGSSNAGFGTPGNRPVVYDGHIFIHAFVPINSGTAEATQLATLGGEIFREKLLYAEASPGCYVRTRTPSVDGGSAGDDDNQWFRVSAAIPFEYWHRA